METEVITYTVQEPTRMSRLIEIDPTNNDIKYCSIHVKYNEHTYSLLEFVQYVVKEGVDKLCPLVYCEQCRKLGSNNYCWEWGKKVQADGFCWKGQKLNKE